MPAITIWSNAFISKPGTEGRIYSDLVVIGGIQSGGLITITSSAYISGIERITSDMTISGKRYSLKSNARIEYSQGSILCDGEEVNNIIDEFGTNVVLRVVTKTFDDEYGDATETFSDNRIKALVMSYSASDDEVKEGVFKSGLLVILFRIQDEPYIITGNRVLYASTWYEIGKVTKQPMMDVNYYLQATLEKI